MFGGNWACKTCYADATRMIATLSPSLPVKVVWHVANISATSRACHARGILSTTQMDKQTAQLFLEQTRSLWQAEQESC